MLVLLNSNYRCKKPYDNVRHYSKDKDKIRCNNCFSKLLKEREKRQQMKRQHDEREQSTSHQDIHDSDDEPPQKMKSTDDLMKVLGPEFS
mgnify:CR=1 FL=1